MDVPSYIYAELIKAGMTKEGACAVLGNVQAESAFRTNNVEDRSGIVDSVYTQRVNSGQYSRGQFMCDSFGYGLAQWTYFSRKGLMWDFFKERGKPIDDLATQVEFLIWEMKNYFLAIWNKCCTSNDLYACTWKLLDEWENPAEKQKNMIVRYSNAQNWFSKFSSVTAPSGNKQDQQSASEKNQNTNVLTEKVESWPPRTIDTHCSGWREVHLLESLLYCRGYSVMNDGIFGESLRKKLIAFQSENGLTADGVCGPGTWKALMSF